jgi:hypothetical protein
MSIPPARYLFDPKEIVCNVDPKTIPKAEGRRNPRRPSCLIRPQIAGRVYRRAPLAAGSVAFLVVVTFFARLALQSW